MVSEEFEKEIEIDEFSDFKKEESYEEYDEEEIKNKFIYLKIWCQK